MDTFATPVYSFVSLDDGMACRDSHARILARLLAGGAPVEADAVRWHLARFTEADTWVESMVSDV